MLSALTLADNTGTDVVFHETSKRGLKKATGLVGITGVRSTVRPRPQGHGSINPSRWTDGKLIALEGETFSNVSVADALAEFRIISAAMVQSLEGGAVMKWTEGSSGLALQATVKLAGDCEPVLQEAAAMVAWAAQFQAEDARAFAQAQQLVSSTPFGASSGGLVFPDPWPWLFTGAAGGASTCVNAGNDATPAIFRIYGGCVAPRVQLGSTGQAITLTGTVAAGDFLEVDVSRRSVLLNGLYNRRNFIDSANTSWFELPKGTSSVRLLSASFDASARLDVIFRSAYR
jgi:hypothetical protein